MMRIGSLCSGGGGLDLAVEEVFDAATAWHCEFDDGASKVLAHRWPGIPNYGNLTETDWTTVEPVDIVCAGWPCQPFSLAGKQLGAEDERAIWPAIARAIRILRPRFVCLENVSAVLGSELHRAANSLSSLGYDIAWTCLRAGDVGAPHRRERLFIVATHTASVGWHQQGTESAGLVGGSHASVGSVTDVDLLPTPSAADGGGGHLSRSGDRSGELLLPGIARAYGNGQLLPTPNAQNGNGGGRFNSSGHQSTLPGTVRLPPTPGASDTRGQDYARAGREGSGGDDLVTAVVKTDNGNHWGKYADAIARWESITRLAPSPTEPNRNGNPRLNPAFSEWMMGWPTGWVTDVPGISRNDQLRIIGNGVVPQCAATALRGLLQLELFSGRLRAALHSEQVAS